MSEFSRYHPSVIFLYFAFVICFSCIFLHPAALGISFFSSFFYLAKLKGFGSALKKLVYIIPSILLMAVINAAFNHEGATIVLYLPGGNPLTLESIVHGFVSATIVMFHKE